MVSPTEKAYLASAAFFGPQSRAPDEQYLDGLHSFLSHNQYGNVLLKEVIDLDNTWKIFTKARKDIQELSQGLSNVDLLRNWAKTGASGSLAAARSGIVAIPLLIILQIGQYLRYLEFQGVSHAEFLAQVRDGGGVQGYCGGLASAIALVCAKDEAEVVRNTAAAVRVLLGVGAYAEIADGSRGAEFATVALRLKHDGQEEELTRRFPGVCTLRVDEVMALT